MKQNKQLYYHKSIDSQIEVFLYKYNMGNV